MRDWLIRLLGGITAEEAEFLRTQAREIHNIREAILTCARGDFQMQAQLQSGETNARAEPAHGMSTQGLKPIKTLSEPWTARRRRLEREDLRRMSEEKNQKYYEGSRGSNGASEILRD